MNYAEIITLADTLDVSVNHEGKKKWLVTECDNGHIKLMSQQIGKDNRVYVIDIYLKQNEEKESKLL